MTFIPVSIQLVKAVNSGDVETVEQLILNSDTKNELINEHILENGKDPIIKLLPLFKSKGLVLNIKALLDL